MPSAAPTPAETEPPSPVPVDPYANSMLMQGIISRTKYVSLVGIACLLIAALAAYGVAVFKTLKTVQETVYTMKD